MFNPTERKSIEFYFDYLSPYAYFAWSKLEGFCRDHGVELDAKPVVFGKLLDHWGHLGPAEIPPKREWLFKYCVYYATDNNLPLLFPKYHPFNSLAALRASLKVVSGDRQNELISAIFHAGWGEGKDIGCDELIIELASKVGLENLELKSRISSPEVKACLKENTDEAISKGVFGIPTIIYNKQLFWGNDQFDYLSAFILGSYEEDEAFCADVLNRPRGIDRNRMG